MASPLHRGLIYRFGLFEVSVAAREVFKQGRQIKLQDQPFKLLLLLLEHPGEVVSRESVRQHLWPENTFVEFDQSLGTAVTKLRWALGDNADNPRFIETVPRRGYKFIAPVTISNPANPESLATVVNIAPEINSKKFTYKWIWAGLATVVLLIAAISAYSYRQRSIFLLAPRDTVVLADFENSTNEPVFDDALRQGLTVGLEQSPFLQVLSDRKSDVILKQMGYPPEQRITEKVAVELCQRTGSKVTVHGSISNIGNTYLLGLTAIRCDNSEPVAHEQLVAGDKEQVLETLEKETTWLRARLGESIPSIQKYNAPLEQATTPSLDALKMYGLALSTLNKQGDVAAIPIFQQAIEFDPNFAMAHGYLASLYANQGELDLARANAIKAYEFKDKGTEFEKLCIESWYQLYVNEDLEKASHVLEIATRNYPENFRILNDLGMIYGNLGSYEKAESTLRASLRIDPDVATVYGNLAVSLMALNRMDDAGAVLAEADKRKLQTDFLLEVNFWRAFVRRDNTRMQEFVAQAVNVPGAESTLLFDQSDAEAYFGHFEKARQLSETTTDIMKQAGDKESAAECWAEAAVRETEIGDIGHARMFVSKALKLARGQDVLVLAALVMAQTGQYDQAQSFAEKLNKEHPSSTLVQQYWLPTIHGTIELEQKKWANAIDAFSIEEPYEQAAPTALTFSTLYPAYLRGQAYLEEGNGQKAEEEFQKLIEHSGMVLNFPLGSLAYLGRARAIALTGDKKKASDAYQKFFELWKDADADLPILKQAKTEYAKLR